MTTRVQLKKKKIFGRESQGAWRQDELTGGKPPVVNSDSNQNENGASAPQSRKKGSAEDSL
jgi:hypothetical protein